jgi:magnesium-transporting ATPase (P-type)
MTMLCSDKTGTLTLNKMMIQEETPVYVKGETQYSLLRSVFDREKTDSNHAISTFSRKAIMELLFRRFMNKWT